MRHSWRMADTPPLADLLRAHPVVLTNQAGKLLGMTARHVRRLHEIGRLSATRHGPAGRSVLELDTDEVLALALARALQLGDVEDQDDDTPDPLQPTLDQAMEDRRSA